MNLYDAEKLAKMYIAKHLGSSWKFAFNKRKGAFGICDYRKREIQLSRVLTAIESESKIVETILHEIGHAMTPNDGHGNKWKAAVRSIGGTPSRVGTSTAPEEHHPDPKWVMVYGIEIIKKYHRKPNRNTLMNVSRMSIVGKPETLGELLIMPYSQYKNIISAVDDAYLKVVAA